MRVLTVNPGSSSLKVSLIGEGDRLLAAEELDGPEADLDDFLRAHPERDAMALRLVHGGDRFVEPVLVSERVEEELLPLAELDRLHMPQALQLLHRLRRRSPSTPLVACFDTAFHSGMPEAARTFAVPRRWRAELGIRRYGFHGLSHAWAARRSAELLGVPQERLRLVSCHIGSGASLAAIRGGRSVATTMGLTPLDGLVMATRPGALDPGVLLRVLRHGGLSLDQLESELEQDSGLRGLSGVDRGDLRLVLEGEARGEPRCALAMEVYLERLCQSIAAMAASLQGLEAIAFTGGAGFRSPELRLRAGERLAFLGVAVDPLANQDPDRDLEIGAASAPVRLLKIEAREDLEMARAVHALLASNS